MPAIKISDGQGGYIRLLVVKGGMPAHEVIGNQIRFQNPDGSWGAWIDLSIGSSTGDMLKSIYDPDQDGKVNAADVADTVPWNGITGKPSTFTPSSHTHAGTDITSKVSNASNADLFLGVG